MVEERAGGTEAIQGRCGVSRRGARLYRGTLSAGNACSQSGDGPDQAAVDALAPDSLQKRLDRSALAGAIWRQRREEEKIVAEDFVRRRLVVSGLFGAGLGIRSGVGPHQGRARR